MQAENINIFATVIFHADGNPTGKTCEYARGSVVVAQSLKVVQTTAKLYCLVTPDVIADDIEFLKQVFDQVVTVPLITHKCVPMKSKKQNAIYGSWIASSFTKLNVLNPDLFPPGAKVILLDADMEVKENIDDLFTLSAPAMTFSSPWAMPYMKGRGGSNPYYNKRELRHGEEVNHKAIRRGFAGGILGLACMVLVEPCKTHYDAMLKLLDRNFLYGDSRCISGFDEQLFAETFLAVNTPIYHIHQQYNWIVGKTNWLLNGEKPKTQQFYNGKPWRDIKCREDALRSEWQDIKEWWVIADMLIAQFPERSDWFFGVE